MNNAVILRFVGVVALIFSVGAIADEDEYINVREDLYTGVELQEVADRAYKYSDEYWEFTHGHKRDDDHDHPEHDIGEHDGTDEMLSAGEAVAEIYANAGLKRPVVDPNALDIVKVTNAVVDAWNDCEDTFDAIRTAVSLMPNRADEIVANIAMKRDCNCSNGGIWGDQRVNDRIRLELRHRVLDVPVQCSCSQIAMYAGIAGLEENRAFHDELSDEVKISLIDRMAEKVTIITERTAAQQNMNGWECGCSNVNIAASMQGIYVDELREGVYDRLAEKYTEEAADTGLVVDSFGVVGMHPLQFWGDKEYATHDNTLRRSQSVFRGDNLILDPFHPATEFTAHGDRDFSSIGVHKHTSGNAPTDVFISEYIEGWNEEALQEPENDREESQHNRVIELYNGSDKVVDLGADQYFLEIYAGPGVEKTVVIPPALVKRTISLQADVTFEFDKSDIRVEASEALNNVVKALNSEDIFSEVLIVGHTCSMGSDEYNLGLSDRRANSVSDFLQKAGLNVGAVRTEGHGEMEPRVANNSISNRSLNRRVEITYVTRKGADIETSVSADGVNGSKRYTYTFLKPLPTGVVTNVESQPVVNRMLDGEYAEGDMSPREVIGLNGAIEPGETYVIAFNESDEVITDQADLTTGQLDFKPNETLLLRRLGGEMALSCRAQNYAYVINYPAIPIIFQPDPLPREPPGNDDVASPN